MDQYDRGGASCQIIKALADARIMVIRMKQWAQNAVDVEFDDSCSKTMDALDSEMQRHMDILRAKKC